MLVGSVSVRAKVSFSAFGDHLKQKTVTGSNFTFVPTFANEKGRLRVMFVEGPNWGCHVVGETAHVGVGVWD